MHEVLPRVVRVVDVLAVSLLPEVHEHLVTAIWQYGEQIRCGSCRTSPPVDLDWTNPSIAGSYGYGACDNMLYFSPS